MLAPIPTGEDSSITLKRGQVLDIKCPLVRLYSLFPVMKGFGSVGYVTIDRFGHWRPVVTDTDPTKIQIAVSLLPVPMDAIQQSIDSAWEFLPPGITEDASDTKREGDWTMSLRYYVEPRFDDIIAIPRGPGANWDDYWLYNGHGRLWFGWEAVEAAIVGQGDDVPLVLARSPREWLVSHHKYVDDSGVEHMASPLTDLALLDLYDVRRPVNCATEEQAIKIRDLLSKPSWALPELEVRG